MTRLPPGVRQRVPLAPLTTLGVGGPARYFVEATDDTTVAAVLRWAGTEGLPTTILGSGSNVVIADEGLDGVTIHIATKGTLWERSGPSVTLKAAAGEDWDELVAQTVARGLAGFECLAGIPGRVGATPIQNVGAYGQEVSDTIVSVRAFDRHENAVTHLAAEECAFAYRTSLFKREPDRFVVLAVDFLLQADGKPCTKYREVEQSLKGQAPSLDAVRAAVLKLRASKSMILDPKDENRRSVGSFFTNPIVSNAVADAIAAGAPRDQPGPMPRYPAGNGLSKVAAAWLIEQAGFRKGMRDGPVGLSSRHALALVNHGGASASDVLRFAREIRDVVQQRFGVALVPEPRLLGITWES